MDTIAFIDANDKSGTRILINGRELIDIVQEVEQPFADRENHPHLAGEYAYFGPMFVFSPAQHFLGKPANHWTDGAGRIYLLSCTCGVPDCWPLSARIKLSEDKIIWSDFRQHHRGPNSPAGHWRYDKLGPFVFDRQSYEQALASYRSADFPPAAKSSRESSENSTASGLDKTRLDEIFSLAFRRGANDRATSGVKRQPPSQIPAPPVEYSLSPEQTAWNQGYSMGYQVGTPDAGLANVTEPAAHVSEPTWMDNRIAELVTKHGAVPPPWFVFPDTHPYDLIWRMGGGESHVMVFSGWWNQKKHELDELQRIDYFRRWPPPPRWLTWMIDVLWDLHPWESDNPAAFDYSPYFARTETLGFGTQAEYERDLNDPKWLGEDSA